MELASELDKLHEVQKLDYQIYQREQAIKAQDDGELLKQAAIAIIKQLDVASEKRKQLHTTLRDQELALKSVEDKRDSVHEKLYSGRIHNPKELGDLQLDEDSLNTHISDLEGPLLEIMEQFEAATKSENELSEKLNAAKKRWKTTLLHTQQETTRLNDEIAELLPQRAEKALLVDKSLLRRYDDIRSRREGIGMVVTASDICPACHITLTPRLILLLREQVEMVLCENCGRILHLGS